MSEKILIVDDDLESLKLISLMLQRRGYEVTAAQSGEQALSKIENENPNLIILDVMMPDIDGYEVCRHLRANPQTSHLPVIMFTAKTLVGDKVAGFQAGADDYLTKPIHPAELVSHVESLLQRSKSALAERRLVSQARIVGVMGAKGGVGASTLALNLAVAACQHTASVRGEQGRSVRVSIADVRPGLGSVALLLGQMPQGGLATLTNLNPANLDQEMIESQISIHSSGLRYLPASLQPDSGQGHLLVDHIDAVLSHMMSTADLLFLDLGSVLDEVTRQAVARCDVVVVVVEPEHLCPKLAEALLDQLESLDPPPGDLRVFLVKRVESDATYSQEEVENLLGRELAAVVKPAGELSRRAVEQGTPIVLMQPESGIAEQLRGLSQELLA
jgi:DNA-binding response OmpR family regulator